MTNTDSDLEYRGMWGGASRLKIDPENHPRHHMTVDHWLITAPAYHLFWSQYDLYVISLADHPDYPPPHRQFPSATHELVVVALNPKEGPYTPEKLDDFAREGRGLPYLEPVNIVEQFEATDEEMRSLASLSAWGVVNGHLNPETADAPDAIRAQWGFSLRKTLAHIRDPDVHNAAVSA